MSVVLVFCDSAGALLVLIENGKRWKELLSDLLQQTAIDTSCGESAKRQELVMLFDMLMERAQWWAGCKNSS